MVDLSSQLELCRANPTAVGCVLSFELTDTWPQLARRIDGLSGGELRLLRERVVGHPRQELTVEEMRAVAIAWGPMPLTGRFIRPLRRHLLIWLMKSCPKL